MNRNLHTAFFPTLRYSLIQLEHTKHSLPPHPTPMTHTPPTPYTHTVNTKILSSVDTENKLGEQRMPSSGLVHAAAGNPTQSTFIQTQDGINRGPSLHPSLE